MINTSCGPLLKSGANRFLEGVYRTFFTMFGNLFKRLAPGRAVKANPTCDYPDLEKILNQDKCIVNPFVVQSGRQAAIMMIAGAMLISFSGVYVKLAHVSSESAGFFRVIFGAAPLLFILCIRKEPLWRGIRPFLLGVGGGLFFAMDLYCWHKSIHYVGPGLATILGNFQVFFLAGIGIFVFGEKVSIRVLLSIPFAILGLFLVVGIKWQALPSTYKTGVFLGVATAICYTFYILALKRLQEIPDPPSPEAGLFVVCLSTAFFFGFPMMFQEQAFLIPDRQTLLALLAYGWLSQSLGWVIISRALPHLKTWVSGLLLLIQPTFAFVWDMIFFNRPASFTDLSGILLTLIAIYLGTSRKK